MQRKDVEALMSYLRGEKEDEAADLVAALLGRAERAEAELADLIHDIERAKEQHTHLLAERDAAFAAGQEEMRERAAKAAEMAFHTGAGANDLLAAHNGGIIMAQNHIRALPIKDGPDGR